MNKPSLLSVAALLFSVAALVVAVSADDAPRDASSLEKSSTTNDDGGRQQAITREGDEASVQRRLSALESEVASLRRQLSSSPRSALAAAGGPSSPGEREQAEDALLDAIESDPDVRERLEGLVSEGLRKEDERRWESRRARWEERGQERLDELAQRASLRPEQVTKLSAMLSAEREEMTALFQKAREEGGGWREMREQARELRTRTDDNARAVLDEEQLPAYQAMREEERPGRRGGRRGGGADSNERSGDERR